MGRINGWWLQWLVWVAISTRLGGCSVPEDMERHEFTELHMGVPFRITLYCEDSEAAIQAARAAFDRVSELNQVMSDYTSSSELMQLCESAGKGPVPVSEDLFEVLSVASDLSDDTNGAFDVTVGPVVKLWRDARRTGNWPSDAAVAQARSRVGWRGVRLDAKAQTVSLTTPGMQLDLGGIAKGFAADEAISLLRDRGIYRCMIDAAGDIVAWDPPPGKRAWHVSVESRHPAPNGGEQSQIDEIQLRRQAVATSGDTYQYVEFDGVRYSHIVDPRTGVGVTGSVSVTVVAPTGMQADALASALSVLGEEAASELLSRYPGTQAWFVRPLNEQGVLLGQ